MIVTVLSADRELDGGGYSICVYNVFECIIFVNNLENIGCTFVFVPCDHQVAHSCDHQRHSHSVYRQPHCQNAA